MSRNYKATVPFGFQLQYEYTGHKGSKVGTKCAVHNNNLDKFVSLDDKSIRIWEPATDSKKGKEIKQINFPKLQTNFIQTIIYIPKIKVYVASALDMTLKIYDGKYTELTSVRTAQRAILCLAYNNERDELVTGGVDGGSLWSFESVKNLLHENDYQGHDIRRRLRFQHDGEDANEWINEIEVDEKRQRVFAMWDNSVDIYDINSGERLGRLLNLHNNTVIGCVYYPINMYLITASKDCTIKVTFGASSTSNAALPVHVFMGHTKEVTGLVLHPQTPNLLLSCSLDGSVRVWNIDTLKEVYRHYVSTPILGFEMLQDEHRLACFTLSGSVLVFTLNHTTTSFALCQSPVMLLETYNAPIDKRLTPSSKLENGDASDTNRLGGLESEVEVPYGTEPAIRYKDCSEGSVMSVSIDGSVRLLRRSDGQCMSLLLPNTTASTVMGVAHSPEQELLFVLLGGTEIVVFCCRSTPCKFLKRWALPHDAPATSMVLCYSMPDLNDDDFKHKHGLLEEEEAALRNVRGGVDPVENSQPEVLAVGNTEGTIQFLDTRKSGKIRGQKQAHKATVRQLLYQHHTQQLVSVGSDDEVRVVEVSGLNIRRRIKLHFKPTCLALAPRAPLLFCGYEDGGLDLVDIKKGQVLEFDREARDHADAVTAAHFSEKLELLVTCSLDKTVKLWDWELNLVRALAMTQPLRAICFRDGYSNSADLVVGEGEHAALLRGAVVLPQAEQSKRGMLLSRRQVEPQTAPTTGEDSVEGTKAVTVEEVVAETGAPKPIAKKGLLSEDDVQKPEDSVKEPDRSVPAPEAAPQTTTPTEGSDISSVPAATCSTDSPSQSSSPRRDRLKVHQLANLLPDGNNPRPVPLVCDPPVIKADVSTAVRAALGDAVGDALQGTLGNLLGEVFGEAFESTQTGGPEGGRDEEENQDQENQDQENQDQDTQDQENQPTQPEIRVPSAPTSLARSQALQTPRERRMVPAAQPDMSYVVDSEADIGAWEGSQSADPYDQQQVPSLDGSVLQISSCVITQKTDTRQQLLSSSLNVVNIEVGQQSSPRLVLSEAKRSEELRRKKIAYLPVPEAPKFLPASSQPIAAIGFADRRKHKTSKPVDNERVSVAPEAIAIDREDEDCVPLEECLDNMLWSDEVSDRRYHTRPQKMRADYQRGDDRQGQVLHCLQLDLTVDL